MGPTEVGFCGDEFKVIDKNPRLYIRDIMRGFFLFLWMVGNYQELKYRSRRHVEPGAVNENDKTEEGF